MKIRTRIAPSPTGYVHIGTLRTALFNYFLARQSGGDFLIRIEDTDRERFVEGSIENLLEVMERVGIEHNEGPVLKDGEIVEKGEFGPYIQSQRLELYRSHVDKLIDQGDAYHCFCSRERLDAMRSAQQKIKQTPKYDRTCLALSSDEINQKLTAGESHVVRLKIPEGETVINDIIRGTVKFQNKEIDDQVILKSDGFPTYHLAVVVDDSLMKITHVLRGEEWLSSTPKHIILYDRLGFESPTYAHVPLLLNPDKSKLSKRQGDVAVEDYLQNGYLPQALVNFVGTLGFNPKSDQEIYTLKELIDNFDLSKVNKSGAILNVEKLDWMNGQYLRELSEKELVKAAKPFLQADTNSDLVRRALIIERDRTHRLNQLQEKIEPYLQIPAYNAEILVWKKSDASDALLQLKNVKEFLSTVSDSDFEAIDVIEEKIKGYIEANELSNGNVLWPVRVALSGQERSASPFDFLWVLQRDESIKRLDNAIGSLV
jgi:nondiscriminating glutamyl-tRNA synthetase